MAARFAAVFGAERLAEVAGLLHDIGKVSAEYQRYIRGEGPSPDHSTAGAVVARDRYGSTFGKLLAFAVAGHHAGLTDGAGHEGSTLASRLAKSLPAFHGWEAQVGPLPTEVELRPTRPLQRSEDMGFGLAFFVRMVFSCLADADFLATEQFYCEAEGIGKPRGGHTSIEVLRDRLRVFMTAKRKSDTPVNRLRTTVLDHAMSKATEPPGLFTLTVPTGGGKTLTSLSFALEHSVRHGLRRIVYVIPYTSIIEQTAEVFRTALGAQDDILEHHSTFDWDKPLGSDAEGREGLAKLRRAAENWDVPIVVTTAVQFFESLFAARSSRCRKLHNLARSVIVLDEAQTLPVHLLRPCMAAIDELARNYGSSIVLCTATQPALRKIDGALPNGAGFSLDQLRELAPEPAKLYQALKRVAVERLTEPIEDSRIVARFAEQPQMLCIVNSRAHAAELFEAIRALPGARHMTTLMCAAHRQKVLAEARADLEEGRPVRLVATSLIEAGVDVDFPEVWRAAAGLDSIAQAAGRCNREGRMEGQGRTVVFEPTKHRPPRAIEQTSAAAREAFRHHGDDPLGLEAVRAYFRALYFVKGAEALDRERILAQIAETARELDFPFARIASAFHLIDEAMAPVLVPYDEEAELLLDRLSKAERPPAEVLRRLQRYVVPVPPRAREQLLAVGAAEAIRPVTNGATPFVRLLARDHYDDAMGLRLDDPVLRAPESNIFS